MSAGNFEVASAEGMLVNGLVLGAAGFLLLRWVREAPLHPDPWEFLLVLLRNVLAKPTPDVVPGPESPRHGEIP
jgi:hypothetical protein